MIVEKEEEERQSEHGIIIFKILPIALIQQIYAHLQRDLRLEMSLMILPFVIV